MTVSEISRSAGFNFALLNQSSQSGQSASHAVGKAAGDSKDDFFSALKLRLAEFQSQTVGALMGSVFGAGSSQGSSDGQTDFSTLLGTKGGASDPLAATTPGSTANGLSPTGRNAALFDPESAYRMMSLINGKEVAYKAQFSELSEMKSFLTELQHDGESLGQINVATDNASIGAQLQMFASQYNEWTQRFDADMAAGGILAGTQAAQVSRYELRQSVENRFNGASDGLHGLRDLGFTIDPVSKLAAFDPARLDAQLAANKPGVVNTVHDFAANFAKSAALLNSAGNFIPNRLGNLERVIDYIDDHRTALQAEFGLGDPVKPAGQVAKALAAYRQNFSA